MNCADCQQSATVYSAGVPLCGACFYQRSVGSHGAAAEAMPEELRQRLTDAIVALETLIARIGLDVDELTKRRSG